MRRFFLSASLISFLAAFGCSKNQPSPPAAANPSISQVAVKSIDPATTGAVSGITAFHGAPPPRTEIDMDADPACAQTKEANRSEAVITSYGKLQNVFVYVKSGLDAYAFKIPAQPAVLDQRGCRYIPHVLGLIAGEKLRVLNSDNAMHNVHPESRNNTQWNDSQMPGGEPIEHVFSNPELLIPVVCNQHPWMKMYVNVVSNPFFAVSDAQGNFEIRGLPPGDYTLEAVHERLGIQQMTVTLAAREKKNIVFTFKP